MGSSPSINSDKKNIYISYDVNASIKYADDIFNHIKKHNYNIVTGNLNLLTFDYDTVIINLNEIMEKCDYIFIIISSNILSSYNQTIELNKAIDYSDKIIYIIQDEIYSPDTNIIIKKMIKNNMCLTCIDDESLDTTLKKIDELLDSR